MDDIYSSGMPSDLSPELRAIDQELAELLKKQTAKIKVIGVGGGGGNSKQNERNWN